jgi:hypothetical protein
MKWKRLIPGLLLVGAAAAFENASPLLVIANKVDLKDVAAGPGAQFHRIAFSEVRESLNECPADVYIFVHQPGLDALDLREESTPFLSRLLLDAHDVQVHPNVLWDDTAGDTNYELREWVVNHCDAQKLVVDTRTGAVQPFIDTASRAIFVDFMPLRQDVGDANEQLLANDNLLKAVVNSLPTPNFVIVYTSSPKSTVVSSFYDPEPAASSGAQIDSVGDSGDASFIYESDTNTSRGSLFDRYQFFSSGIFMALLASIFMLWVLFSALGWLASLQVSYLAFAPPTNIAKKVQ